MRVLHVLSKLDKGGAESRIIEVQTNLYPKGVVFDYLLGQGGEHFYTDDAKSMDSTIHVIPHPVARTMISYILKVKKLVAGNYSIVHSHLSVFSGFVLLGAKLGGAKIRIAHSRSGPLSAEVKKFPLKRRLLLHFYRLLIKYTATHRVSCSTDGATYLYGEKAVKNGDVVYIRNAVSFDRFNVETPAEVIRRRFSIDPGTEVFVNVANLLPVKNHIFLVRVFNEYQKYNKSAVLLIAGEGSEREAIERTVEELGNDSIVLLGRCDNVPELLKIADYFVMTSRYEGVPGAAIEAMASGVPCYLSDKITRDIDFGENITRYFSIESAPDDVAQMIFQTKNSMDHSKGDFQQILKSNYYDVNEASDEVLRIYEGKE